jgi:hypothetical protein
LRRAARIDANQPETIAHLRKLGWSVKPTHTVGDGFPDLVAGKPGFNCLVELKDGGKPPSERKLTEDQEDFAKEWTGPYVACLGPEDCAAKLEVEYRGAKALFAVLSYTPGA